MEDISHMTGQGKFNAPQPLRLDEMKLVGNSIGKVGGYFKLVELTKDKDENNKYPIIDLPKLQPVAMVLLINRRRLVESTKEGLKRYTTEHDNPDDVVQLFGEGKDRAPASELRIRHEKLRTEQVVYAW